MAHDMRMGKRLVVIVVLLAAAGLFAWQVWRKLPGSGEAAGPHDKRAMPVEVAPLERGHIELRRTFSGTLEAPAAFDMAAKISGRIESVSVDIGDTVERGRLIVQLDDDELEQAVALAEAELEVAKANLAEAQSRRQVAQREYDRVRTLSEKGVASESRLDTVLAEQHAADAAVQVAAAQVNREEANLATAKIRLSYTRVTAAWVEGDGERLVSHRFVDPGNTVSANQPLVSIVEVDPLVGVIYVTESDYARLSAGQHAELATDAYPDQTFACRVSRISPVFEAASRQARVELTVENHERALKPGMFIRVMIVLDAADDAVIAPASALTRRNDANGVFLVSDDGQSVAWHRVQVGIRDGERVQVVSEGLRGNVVTLGQQLLEDGSAIVTPDREAAP